MIFDRKNIIYRRKNALSYVLRELGCGFEKIATRKSMVGRTEQLACVFSFRLRADLATRLKAAERVCCLKY